MEQFLFLQGEFILRLLLSALLGAVIGFERKSRGKEAGLRTHIIVAIASAAMMIISKYGFSDFNLMNIGGTEIKFDPTRIASQIVTGVGFLGAGTIFFSKKTVYGLTTAAGIWATSGVGMAVGAGMYIFGILACVLIVFSQVVLHLNFKFLKTPQEEHITITIDDTENCVSHINEILLKHKIQTEKMNLKRVSGSLVEIDLDVVVQNTLSSSQIIELFEKTPCIKSIKI